jgi:polar amino acid transport system substrate-binding protein
MIRRALLLWLCLSAVVSAAPLEVGIKPAPPFVMQDRNGQWTGISVDLWRAVAEELDIAYTLQPYDLNDLLLALESGTIDVGVGALTVTAERETRFDFCMACTSAASESA